MGEPEAASPGGFLLHPRPWKNYQCPESHHRASSTDPNSNTTDVRTDRSGLGMASQLTDPDGNVSTLDLDSNGLPIVAVDRLNRISRFVYDSSGNITKQAYPDLNTDQYTYNSFSEPLTHKEPTVARHPTPLTATAT